MVEEKSNWIKLIEVSEVPENIDGFNVDTRSFHCIAFQDEAGREEVLGWLGAMYTKQYIEQMAISRDKILPWMMDLYKASGGEGDARMLFFTVPQHSGVKYYTGWVKYIRFIRYKQDKYIPYVDMCNEYWILDPKIYCSKNLQRDRIGLMNFPPPKPIKTTMVKCETMEDLEMVLDF